MIEMDSSDLIESTVTSTRVRLARNLFSYPFPDKLDEKRAREIIRVVGYELNRLDTFTEYDIGKIEPDEATFLLEKHLISPDLIRRKSISAAFITSDEEISVMINEEDHLREQYILRGAISIRRTSASAASTTASAAPSASLTTKNWAISRRVRAISARGCALR